jgi:SAM-dependent methyltransferase
VTVDPRFDEHRLSFGNVADDYDRARPTYPADAVTWAVGPDALCVLDLGAGTGLLTRVGLKLGLDMIAVEPDPGMRHRFDEVTPGVTALAGSAEEIPLEDASVDAVIVGQAYHWFDPPKALPEIARVLRQGGAFAPIWNFRSLDQDWTKRLDEIMNGGRTPPWSRSKDKDFGPLFTPIEERLFGHVTRQTRKGLRDLVASRSHFLVAPPETQAQMLRQVDELAAGLTGDGFDLPYSTLVRRAFKR